MENHKDVSDRFLSISDINRLINIDYDRLRSICIEYRKYRLVTPCVKLLNPVLSYKSNNCLILFLLKIKLLSIFQSGANYFLQLK